VPAGIDRRGGDLLAGMRRRLADRAHGHDATDYRWRAATNTAATTADHAAT
jgi:hypothetical protein